MYRFLLNLTENFLLMKKRGSPNVTQKFLNFGVGFVLRYRFLTQGAEVCLYLWHRFSTLMTGVGDRCDQRSG
jgi:hypothetical protein